MRNPFRESFVEDALQGAVELAKRGTLGFSALGRAPLDPNESRAEKKVRRRAEKFGARASDEQKISNGQEI